MKSGSFSIDRESRADKLVKRPVQALLIIIVLVVPSAAMAVMISDLDLNGLSFEAAFTPSGFPTSASGTSNGIGWSVSIPAGFWADGSNQDSSQTYNDLPDDFDDVHLGNDFTLTFDEGITHLLVAMANGEGNDGPNFGIAPVDVVDFTVSGTQLDLTDAAGGLALFEFSSPITTLVHTNTNQLDGWDLSFFAYQAETNASVPAPGSLALILIGLCSGLAVPLIGRAQRRFRDRSGCLSDCTAQPRSPGPGPDAWAKKGGMTRRTRVNIYWNSVSTGSLTGFAP